MKEPKEEAMFGGHKYEYDGENVYKNGVKINTSPVIRVGHQEKEECKTCDGSGFVGGVSGYLIGEPCPECRLTPQPSWEEEFDRLWPVTPIVLDVTKIKTQSYTSGDVVPYNPLETSIKSFIKNTLSQERARVVEIGEMFKNLKCECPEVPDGMTRINHVSSCPKSKRSGMFYEDGINDLLNNLK